MKDGCVNKRVGVKLATVKTKEAELHQWNRMFLVSKAG